jgi:uncharacterized damage-inducible protein DinB
MVTEVVRSLYRYNTWANAQIMKAAAKLTPAQLTPRSIAARPRCC